MHRHLQAVRTGVQQHKVGHAQMRGELALELCRLGSEADPLALEAAADLFELILSHRGAEHLDGLFGRPAVRRHSGLFGRSGRQPKGHRAGEGKLVGERHEAEDHACFDRPSYYTAAGLDDALSRLAELGSRARIVAGATDLWRGETRGAHALELMVDITRIPGLDGIADEGETLCLGPLVTHSQIIRSASIVRHALPLAQASLDLGTPQVRNRGTLAGSIVSAHASSDPLPALIALGATLRLRSKLGERRVVVADLGCGEEIDAQEMITEIAIPKLGARQRGLFAKHRARSGVGVATVNLAAVLSFACDTPVAEATLVAGGCGPTAVANAIFPDLALDDSTLEETARVFASHVFPVDDLRASSDYRRAMLEVLVRRALRTLRDGGERSRWPTRPVALWGRSPDGRTPRFDGAATTHDPDSPIVATLNGVVRRAPGGEHRSLLEWLREGVGVKGCKSGCEEGVCGACTVLLDGLAVVSCLVPAARAHGAAVTTVEGLGEDAQLTTLQRAFVKENAVQCGYCTPGILVASTSLLDNAPEATRVEIESALAGNLCRCTGYRSILRAVQCAAEERRGRDV